MTNIVQKNSDLKGFLFIFRNVNAFKPQYTDLFLHEMNTAERVMKTGVMSPRVDQIRESHLWDTAQSLEIFMLHDIEQ